MNTKVEYLDLDLDPGKTTRKVRQMLYMYGVTAVAPKSVKSLLGF